jgi:hypothetical protein
MLTPRGGPWPDADMQPTVNDVSRGWYLYGVTRNGHLAAVLAHLEVQDQAEATPGASGDAGPLQLFEFSGLAAVVRPVFLSDFTPAVVHERLQDASVLEETVRSHNRVIQAIHAAQAILPAKFGMVYARTEDVVSALRPAHETFLHQLARVDGCDEWAIHLFADPSAVRERIATASPDVLRLRSDRAAARPGRAYFIDQQISEVVQAGTEQALLTMAHDAFDRLVNRAVAGQVNPLAPTADPAGEVEILRATFLVARDHVDAFTAEVHALAQAGEQLRCETSGPWPPYSFVARDGEEAI